LPGKAMKMSRYVIQRPKNMISGGNDWVHLSSLINTLSFVSVVLERGGKSCCPRIGSKTEGF
jgi:hypothetical protein